MAIPLLDRRGRPTGEVLEREQFHRSASVPPEERHIHPALHTTIYDLCGRVLEQKRAKTKKFFPGIWLPLNGGHGDERDLHKKNSHYVFRWAEGATRELREELRIIVDPRDLRILDERLVDFTNVSGFENLSYLTLYSLVYNPDKHGKIDPNPAEVDEVRFRNPTYGREFNLLKCLGNEYASRISRKIVARSKKIVSAR